MNPMRALFSKTRRVVTGAGAALAAIPSIALAGLPKQESITSGGDGNLFGTVQNVGQKGFSLGFIVLCAVGIAAFIIGLIYTFNEARERGKWGAFGTVVAVGVVMLVIVIWLANYGDPIMGGK